MWYFDRYPLNQKINEHEVFGIARYKPTLLIKPIKTTSQKLDYRNFNILGRPSPTWRSSTLCEQFNRHRPIVSDVPGINLMQDDLKGEASSHVFIEIIPDKNGSLGLKITQHLNLTETLMILLERSKNRGYFGIQMSAFRRYEHPF